MSDALTKLAEGERLWAMRGLCPCGCGAHRPHEALDWMERNADALIAVAQAAAKRLHYGHNDTCSAVLGIEPPHNVCSCGHDEQAAALQRLTETDHG